MSDLSDVRTAIDDGRKQLDQALAACGERWGAAVLAPEAEEVNPRATGDAWTPRQAAEHAIGGNGMFVRMVAAGLERDAPALEPLSRESADDARAALRTAIERSDGLLDAVAADDLARPTGLADRQIDYARSRGREITKSVEGALWMMALHMADHAQQIAGAGER